MNLGISTKGEYGVRIMVDLARHFGEQPRSLTDIAQAELLPLAYLEQLIKLLREAEPQLVSSTRGAHGGYRLSRPPEQITMGEVVRVLEGPIAPMICATEGEMSQICGFLASCKTHYLWAKLRDVVAQTLDGMTLADLLQAETSTMNREATGRTAASTMNREATVVSANQRFIPLSDIQPMANLRIGADYLSPGEAATSAS
jgi:Rrf2 family transcriptional regulator, cysteine metabolism repressor